MQSARGAAIMHTESIVQDEEKFDTIESTILTTTLYDLLAAIQSTIEPGEEELVVPIVAHILRTGRVTWKTSSALNSL